MTHRRRGVCSIARCRVLRSVFGYRGIVLMCVSATACRAPTRGEVRGRGRILWSVPLTEPSGSGWPGIPAVVGPTAYIETSNTVLALDVGSGARRWQTVIKSATVPSAANIAAAGGALFVAETADVVSLDAGSGAIRWRFTPDAQAVVAQTAADDHAAYIGTRSHKVYALDEASGQPLWTTDIGADWPYFGIVTGLTISGDTVYAGATKRLTVNGDSSVGVIAGLDRRTGLLLFRYQAPQSVAASSVSSAPVVSGTLLLASDLGGAFYAIDRFALRERWRVTSPPGTFGPFASPTVRDGRVYVGSNDTYVYASDLATGAVAWRTPTQASIHASAVCGPTVFANNQAVFAIDTAGHVVSTTFDDDPNEIPTSGFAVAADRVIVSGLHGVYAMAC